MATVATAGKTRNLTAPVITEKVQAAIEESLAYYSKHPEEMDSRLLELDREWDVERAIEAEAAGSVLAGFVLGTTVSRKWFLLPAFAGAMMLLHAIRGEYPLLPVFRRLGFRTASEIAQERYALKALRGDFDSVDPAKATEHAEEAFDAASPSSLASSSSPIPL